MIAVSFAGLPADLEPLERVRDRVVVIEDAAHALGARRAGGLVGGPGGADMTTFSLHPVKAITTGEGGFVATGNDEFARAAPAVQDTRHHQAERDAIAGARAVGTTRCRRSGSTTGSPTFSARSASASYDGSTSDVERRNRDRRARYRELLAERRTDRSPAGGARRDAPCLPPIRRSGPRRGRGASGDVLGAATGRHRRAGALHPDLPPALLSRRARATPRTIVRPPRSTTGARSRCPSSRE